MLFPRVIVDLPTEQKEIEIIGLGDVHYGSQEHNGKLFDEIIEKIRTQDNLYCILLGDLIECVTKDSVGDLFTQIGTPHDQANYIVKKLEPIKHKILAMTSGNHCNRIYKTSGFDISLYIAEKLEIAERYHKSSFILFVKFGKQKGIKNKPHCWSIFVSHGNSGSTKKGGKLNQLLKLQQIVVGCDVYIMGHVHDYLCTYEENFIVDINNRRINQKTSCLFSQGACLDFGGYGYENGYKPLAQKYGIITLGYVLKHDGDHRYISVRG